MNVVLLSDYKEENWHSMELYADRLQYYLTKLRNRDLLVNRFVSLPRLSSRFDSRHKYMRECFRYIINPIGVRFQRGDVFHITDHANAHLLAVVDQRRTIVTCHDLTSPYWMMRNVKITAKKRVRYAVERKRLGMMRRAARIIAVSDATKFELCNTLDIPVEKVIVIHEGVDRSFHPVTDQTVLGRIKRKYALPGKFFLNVGTTYYNKNMHGLLKFFSILSRIDQEAYLVKCGDPWTEDQQKVISSMSERDRILHLGFVPQRDLPPLYSQAQALVSLSKAEGFGFTPLEAMACGCPVVVSPVAAHAEVVGKAGMYLASPTDAVRIRTISRHLNSRNKRRMLRSAGLTRAKKFSWNTCARKTLAVYQDVARLQT